MCDRVAERERRVRGRHKERSVYPERHTDSDRTRVFVLVEGNLINFIGPDPPNKSNIPVAVC